VEKAQRQNKNLGVRVTREWEFEVGYAVALSSNMGSVGIAMALHRPKSVNFGTPAKLPVVPLPVLFWLQLCQMLTAGAADDDDDDVSKLTSDVKC